MKNLISSNDLKNVDYGTALVKNHAKHRNQKCSWPYFPRRYYVTIMAFLGFWNLFALRMGLSVAVVEMKLDNDMHDLNNTVL